MNGFTPSGAGKRLRPSLLLALTTTSFLVLVPLGAAWAVQILSPAHDLVLSITVGMLVSLGITWLATTLWARSTRAGERVFGDVTLLGLWRYERANRQVAQLEAVMADRETITDDQARLTMINLADALERRDLRTHGHSRRVARHSAAIAREMGLPAEEVARIRFAAAMHDIGKLNVPAEILFKPDELTREEFAVIKQHPVDSAKMVEVIDDRELIAIIRGHHERWDGGGYPDCLAGTEIPLGARIIAVADTFDALVSDRPYSGAAAHKKSREIIAEASGSQFDPQVANAFRQYYRGGNWHVAWGAVAALPPRIATLIGDLLRGGIPTASAAPAVAAVAIAAAGMASVGGLPGTSNPSNLDRSGAAAVVPSVDGSGARTVTLPDGVRINPKGDPRSDSGSATETGNKPGSSGGESGGRSESKNDVGDTVKDTTTDTTDKTGDTVKDVGDTVDEVGDTVTDVGNGDLTDTVGETVKEVGGTVTDTGEAVKETGDAVGGVVGGALGEKK